MSASTVVIEDLFERLPAVNDENAYVDELAEKEKKRICIMLTVKKILISLMFMRLIMVWMTTSLAMIIVRI